MGGLVFYVNAEKTKAIKRPSASNAQWFEDQMPGDPKYRKSSVNGIIANAIDVSSRRATGPVTPVGINLPNDERIREQYGSTSASLSNIVEAYDESAGDRFATSFRGRLRRPHAARSGGSLAD